MKFGTAMVRLAQTPTASLSSPAQMTARPQPTVHPDSSPLSHDFEELVYRNMRHVHVPGLAVAIVDGNDTFSRGYGISRFPDVPVTSDTMFYGASTTKAFIAAALSLVVDDDESFPHVRWQTPIAQIIPNDFVLEDDYSTLQLTLEDAATHRTGMPRHDWSIKGGNQTIGDVVRSLRYLPLTEPLRTTFQYCNLMYVTLSHVIETLLGQWTGTFLAERIWAPLNMTSTYFSLSDARKSGRPLAQSYYWRTESETFTAVEPNDETSTEGAGGVISSVNDYSKWIRMMIDRAGPISKRGHHDLTTPRILEEELPNNFYVFYGYGWEIEMYRGYEIITHSGVETGFGTTVRYIPEKRWGCVMMGNTMVYSNLVQEMLIWHLIDDVLETPDHERLNLTAAVDAYVADYILDRNTTLVKEVLYPSNETVYIPHSLPLAAYAGLYSHPGYGDWPINYRNGTLWNTMDRPNVVQYDGKLDHITAEHFLVIAYDVSQPDDPAYLPTEFRIHESGTVWQMGIQFEESMKGEKIWFDKK